MLEHPLAGLLYLDKSSNARSQNRTPEMWSGSVTTFSLSLFFAFTSKQLQNQFFKSSLTFSSFWWSLCKFQARNAFAGSKRRKLGVDVLGKRLYRGVFLCRAPSRQASAPLSKRLRKLLNQPRHHRNRKDRNGLPPQSNQLPPPRSSRAPRPPSARWRLLPRASNARCGRCRATRARRRSWWAS